MAKTLIILNNPETLVDDFNSHLDGNTVPFVVLGNTANHQSLAHQAANLALNWELAIYVPEPAGLYPTLLSFPTDDASLPAVYDPLNMFAVAIATDKTICYVMTDYDAPSIALAYMSAETH
jgi:hypothetical protein